MNGKLTWKQMVDTEPLLGILLNDAKNTKDTGGAMFCANAVWYGESGLKHRLCQLVGWEADKAMLRTSQAYDKACDEVYNSLPDCRNCWCFGAGNFEGLL